MGKSVKSFINTIVLLNKKGEEQKYFQLNIGKNSNSGVEGVSYNSENGHFFVIKEKDKGLLLDLDSDFKEISRKKLNFAKDYSGIFYEKTNKHLWILSDESRLLAECDLLGNAINKYKVKVRNPEGLSIDFANKKIYIVSDSAEKLYVFEVGGIK